MQWSAIDMIRKAVGVAIAAILIGHGASARPLVIEESAKFTGDSIAPNFEAVRLSGNDLLALRQRAWIVEVVHFERTSSGAWQSKGVITTGDLNDRMDMSLSFANGRAVLIAGNAYPQILDRTPSGWTQAVLPFRAVSQMTFLGGTAVVARAEGEYNVIEFMAQDASGNWISTDMIWGPIGYPDGDFIGPRFSIIDEDRLAVNHASSTEAGNVTYVYERIGGEWIHTETVPRDHQFVTLGQPRRIGEWAVPGDLASCYTQDENGEWTVRHSALSDEWYANKRVSTSRCIGVSLPQGALTVAAMEFDDARGVDAGSIGVFRREGQHARHVATLLASDSNAGMRLGRSLSMSGSTVAVIGYSRPDPESGARTPSIYVFEIPQPLPAVLREQDTFEDMNAAGWTPWGKTNWRVVASGSSRVFRQTNMQGDARAVFDGHQDANQSIQADVKVNAFGNIGWAGMLVRYVDARNFYYLMNENNTLQIRKIVNGVFGPIASTPFTLQPGRTYRLRLEAIGTRLRAYADDKLILEVSDATHESGRAGLTMWKANVDYDNVVISSSPYTTLHADTFSSTDDELISPAWVTSPSQGWSLATSPSGATVFRQSLAWGDARAVQGAPTEDQILTADIRPLSFNPAAGSDFVGLMARHIDNRNYYYVLLTKSGKASLRRLTQGRLTVLDEANLTVTPGTNYRVRFEAIGSSLRFYVNGRLMAEAEDSMYPRGRYGLVTYRGAAEYDNFNVNRP